MTSSSSRRLHVALAALLLPAVPALALEACDSTSVAPLPSDASTSDGAGDDGTSGEGGDDASPGPEGSVDAQGAEGGVDAAPEASPGMDAGHDAPAESSPGTDSAADAPAESSPGTDASEAAAPEASTDAAPDSSMDASDASDANPNAPVIFILTNTSGNGVEVWGFPAGGGGGNPTATYYAPTPIQYGYDLGVDAQGYIYVAGQTAGVNAIYVFAPGGNGLVSPTRTITGAGTGLSAMQLADVSVEPDGTVYVSGSNGAVLGFAPGADGNASPAVSFHVTSVTGGASTGASYPFVVTPGGNVFQAVGDPAHGTAVGVFTTGVGNNYALPDTSTVWLPVDAGTVISPTRFARDPVSGNILMINNDGGHEFLGVSSLPGPTFPAQDAHLVQGNALATDSLGRVYVLGTSQSTNNAEIDVFPQGFTGTTAPLYTFQPAYRVGATLGIATLL